jgi:uncharacterized membrane protein YdjX (TVP38/TMEM64 family)
VLLGQTGANPGVRDAVLQMLEWVRQQGDQAILVFILIDAVWIVIGMPAGILSLGAAVLFGFWRGLFAVWVAANIAAVISFYLARYLLRGWLAEKIRRRPKFAAVDRAVGRSGWQIVLMMRLSPIFPFGIFNYALGLTAVNFRDYMFGTAIGVIPGTAAYIYAGTLIRDLANLSGPRPARTPLEWTFYVVGLIATVLVCAYIFRLARSALAQGELEQPNRRAAGDQPG